MFLIIIYIDPTFTQITIHKILTHHQQFGISVLAAVSFKLEKNDIRNEITIQELRELKELGKLKELGELGEPGELKELRELRALCP